MEVNTAAPKFAKTQLPDLAGPVQPRYSRPAVPALREIEIEAGLARITVHGGRMDAKQMDQIGKD
jgi:hypothetical protein